MQVISLVWAPRLGWLDQAEADKILGSDQEDEALYE